MEFRKNMRDLKARSAAKEHRDTNAVRDGDHNPGVRRPGAGLGQSPARFLGIQFETLFLCVLSDKHSS